MWEHRPRDDTAAGPAEAGSTAVSGHLYLYLLAVGALTALTPWAVVGLIVLLGSPTAPRTGIAFVAGWFCAVVVVAGVVAAGFGQGSAGAGAGRAVALAEILIGAALVGFAARRRALARSRPGAPSEPAWLTTLERFGPILAFAFGTFMINAVFVVDAGVRIAQSEPGTGEAALAILFYGIVSTAGLAAILVAYFADRSGAEARLAAMRSWVVRNNPAIVVGILAVVGVALVVKGVSGLAG